MTTYNRQGDQVCSYCWELLAKWRDENSSTNYDAIDEIYDHNSLILEALRDLVQFVQFKKREKHPWRSDTFSLQFY